MFGIKNTMLLMPLTRVTLGPPAQGPFRRANTPPYELTLRLGVESHRAEAPSEGPRPLASRCLQTGLPPVGLHTAARTRSLLEFRLFHAPALSPVQEEAWWGAWGARGGREGGPRGEGAAAGVCAAGAGKADPLGFIHPDRFRHLEHRPSFRSPQR